jgi:threonine dehydrogenase-like Zn-dependent dehydrogenase
VWDRDAAPLVFLYCPERKSGRLAHRYRFVAPLAPGLCGAPGRGGGHFIGHEITAESVAVDSGVDPDGLRMGGAVTRYFDITCGYCK